MAVLKYHDGTGWEPVVSALQGPTGDAGAVYQDNEPTDTGVLWVDTDDDGFLVVPNGGATGAVLTKQSSADYDTGWDLPVNSGLVHIETQTVSAASAFNFSNDVFSATYDNYKIVLNMVSSTGNFLAIRGRTSGSSNSNANYTFQFLDIGGTGVSAARTTNQTSGRVASVSSTTIANGYVIDIFSPFTNTATTYSSRGYNSSSNASFNDYVGAFYNAAIFDSIEFLASTGTVTGKAILYGYKQ